MHGVNSLHDLVADGFEFAHAVRPWPAGKLDVVDALLGLDEGFLAGHVSVDDGHGACALFAVVRGGSAGETLMFDAKSGALLTGGGGLDLRNHGLFERHVGHGLVLPGRGAAGLRAHALLLAKLLGVHREHWELRD